MAKRSTEKYETFLDKVNVEVAPISKLDAEEAARFRPSRDDLLDALIAASVRRYNASIWTSDRDFLKFLPNSRVRVF